MKKIKFHPHLFEGEAASGESGSSGAETAESGMEEVTSVPEEGQNVVEVPDDRTARYQKAREEFKAEFEEELNQAFADRVGEMEQLRKENAAARGERDHARAQLQVESWMKEAAEVSEKWPQFRFEEELKREDFGRLLRAGVSVEHAFQVVHADELMQSAMAATANNVAAQTAANIAARGQRPRENGATSGGAAVIKSDVSKLTRADRKEIARRVRMGENITF